MDIVKIFDSNKIASTVEEVYYRDFKNKIKNDYFGRSLLCRSVLLELLSKKIIDVGEKVNVYTDEEKLVVEHYLSKEKIATFTLKLN